MQRQPLEIQTLCTELLEQLSALEARRSIGHLSGGFITKTVKKERYYYFQHSEPGGKKRQLYIGRKDSVLDKVVARHGEERESTSKDTAGIQRLCALLRAGGIMETDTASAWKASPSWTNSWSSSEKKRTFSSRPRRAI